MDRQQEFVLRTIEERDIRFVRLWFTDVVGTLKSVAVAPAELEGAFGEGIGFDGSAIEGFARQWRPRGLVLVLAEVIYTVTDPPLRVTRRIVPTLNLGGVRIDLAFIVLFLVTTTLMGLRF